MFMTPDASQTIEPARGSGAAPELRTAPARGAVRPQVAGLERLDAARPTASSRTRPPRRSFSPHSWYVAPPPPPPAPRGVPRAAAAADRAAAAVRVHGQLQRGDGAVQTYFLTAGDRVYDVKVGDTLDNTYSVDGVKSGQLLLTYMPLKIQQSLAVGDE